VEDDQGGGQLGGCPDDGLWRMVGGGLWRSIGSGSRIPEHEIEWREDGLVTLRSGVGLGGGCMRIAGRADE
jgi:hypothetical protein